MKTLGITLQNINPTNIVIKQGDNDVQLYRFNDFSCAFILSNNTNHK